jgi:argininosuccinate lyase
LRIAEEGLEVFADFLEKMKFNCAKSRQDAERYYATSSDTAEAIALGGTPFRTAYFQVAEQIKRGAAQLLNVEQALRRPTAGSANPEEVKKMASARLVFCRSLIL